MFGLGYWLHDGVHYTSSVCVYVLSLSVCISENIYRLSPYLCTVDDGAILDVQFSDFSFPTPDGFDRIMFEKNIL